MVEWSMIAMDMPTDVAIWDKLEWSIEAADKVTDATDIAEAGNGLYHDRCCYPCHDLLS
ncbi:hypothetical protein A2U01_0035017 [Trifolium medium]|uniref:Uncharacterized protein n=1 Tax=Trifolium medium TaxID=97028 RepID=A0A392PSJ9_9FABA|nr:hypothetical protein [Trifolium medium]